ncbi:MAG: HD-GYP domain-containing protein [bacterium]|nr:HD-GYP domain-containing protein [bacterium]
MKSIIKLKYTASAISIIIAGVGLISYLLESRILASLHKDFIPMAPSTSVSFLILAAIVILHNFIIKNKSICFAVVLIVLLVSLFGLLEIPGHFLNIDQNFEDILMPDFGKLGKFPIARMSPSTGGFFFISGISAILLLLVKKSSKQEHSFLSMSGILSCIILVSSIAILLSYFHPKPILYDTEAIPMALTTAICFLLLSISLIFSLSSNIFPVNLFIGKSTQSKLMRVFVPLSIGIIIVTFVIIQDIMIPYLNIHSSIIITISVVIIALITGYIVVKISQQLGKNIDYYQNEINKAQNNASNIAKFPEENPSPVLRISKDKKILYANKASKILLTSEKLSKGNEFLLWSDHIDEVIHTRRTKYIECPFFNLFWYAWNIVPIIDKGYINIYGTNITKRKQSEIKLKKSFEDIIFVISKATEKRDPYTAGHQLRVAKLAVAIAEKMKLSEEQIKTIYYGAIIHDIGKLYVPSDILNRPGKLTESEMNIIKEHPAMGYEIIEDINFVWPIKKIILHHHEKLNGSGYPDGLKGKKIDIACRIVCVADVVEAMNTHRPYRPARGFQAAIDEIKKGRNILYDPQVVDACIELLKENNFLFEE